MAIVQAYLAALHALQLSGPTNFSPILREISQTARGTSQYAAYHVLLILTDGAITDMQETLRSLKKAEGIPLSVIIVGIGNADFSSMEILDGDGDDKAV